MTYFTVYCVLFYRRLSGNPITNLDSGAFLNLKKLNALWVTILIDIMLNCAENSISSRYLDDIFVDIDYDILSTLNVSLL